DMMRGYAETRGCRRQFLLSYFGEASGGSCGNCDNCRSDRPDRSDRTDRLAADGVGAGLDVPPGEPAESDEATAGVPFPVGSHVEHVQWGRGQVLEAADDRITVLFDDVGYRTLSTEAVQQRGLLQAVEAVTD
nr:DUF3553 domain-containing protein [Micromonospora sp. DSM 115978]